MTNRAINLKVNVDQEPVASLRQQLRDVRIEIDQIAGSDVVDQDALQSAIARMAELKDQTADVNEQVNLLATGSKFEAVSNSIGQMKDALFNLDFDKLKERSEAFSKSAKKISFKDAANSFKSLGSTMVNIGKTMLVNPMFILGAVIGLIVNAVLDLMKEFGVLEEVIKIVTMPLNILIAALRSVMEWMGFTSSKSEEESEKMAEAQEAAASKVIEAFDKQKQAVDDYYSSLEGDISNELKLLKAKSDGSEESVNAIIDAERRLLLANKAKLEATIKIEEKLLKLMETTGTFTKQQLDDQIRKVGQLNTSLKGAATDIEAFEIKTANGAAKRGADAAKKNADARKKADEDRKKATEETAKFELETVRRLEDISDQAIEDEEVKADVIATRKIQRAREDFKKSAYYLRLKAEDETNKTKKSLTLLNEYDNQIAAIEQNRIKTNETKEQKDEQLEKDRLERIHQLELEYKEKTLALDDYEGQKALLQERYTSELDLLKQQLDKELLTKEEYVAQVKLLDLDLAKNKEELDKKEKADQKALQDAKVDMAFAASESIMGLLNSLAGDNEKAAKRMFKINKAYQLGQAIANTALAVTAALTAGGNPAKLATGAQFVEAGIAATTGIANIATIAKQQFGGGGSTPTTPSVGGGGGSGGGGNDSNSSSSAFTQTQPIVNFNQNSNAGNVTDFGNQNSGNSNITLNNKISISETEITDVQMRNLKLQNNAQL